MADTAHVYSWAAALEVAIVMISLACGGCGAIVALRARSSASVHARALQRACAREAAFIDAARRLAGAARVSVDAVREEVARAARVAAPSLDGVLLYEEHEGALLCVYAYGDRFAYFAGTCVAVDDPTSLPARAFAAGHRITLDRDNRTRGEDDALPAADDTRVARIAPIHPTDAAVLAVPLALDAGRACVLAVCTQGQLDPDAIDQLAILADQAAPAYCIALDREHDRRDAEYDGLTGLLTPRAFRRRLTTLVDRARFVPSARLALLFVDTDHFKRWNDSYGHAAGDALLRELARVLRSIAAVEHDLVARNGGDEFCIVLTETDKATAIERAEALRRRIAAIDAQISASIGVAAFPADAANANDLLERADGAMYHAKETGRDGVSYSADDGSFQRFEA